MTLCAVTFVASCAGVAPAQAADDTASVGNVTPNLQAAAQALNAAIQQLNNSTNTGGNTNTNNSGSNESNNPTVNFDYVTLEDPAVTYDGQVYLPLRSTFKVMKTEALEPTWKPEGQNKMMLSSSKGNYELYLTADGTGIQIQQGGTTYPLKAVNGVTYVSLNFFQALIQAANVGLSGDNLLVLEAKNGANNVWNSGVSFWTAMNAYTAPVKPVETPDITVPDVQKPQQPQPQPQPSKPTPDITVPDVQKPNTGGNTGSSSTGGTTGGTTTVPSGTIGTSKVPMISCKGGNGLIADTLFWPTSVTYISSLYGYRIDPVGGIVGDFHLGVDIAGPVGTPIYAAQGGTVIRASWFSTYGNCIDIQHPSGLVTRYAHLSAYNVSVGDTVKQGQTIAAMGATGNVTGPHVHFETIINGKTVDPANYINLKAVM